MTAIDTHPSMDSGARPNFVFEAQDTSLSRGTTKLLFITLGVFFALRLALMWVFPFTDSTESRYGEIARKMIETGNWITPQFDYGVPFWGKPPLHTWLSASGMQLLGINEFAGRLPILLTALLVLALIYYWVAELAGKNAALLSVVVLSSGGLFFGASAFIMTDMPMLLGTTLVMVGFWNAACQPVPDRRWGVAIGLGLAIGMLAKGPVAVVLCMIPLLIWLTVSFKWKILGHLPWVKGGALFIALTSPWYIAAEIATPGFLSYFIVGEHFDRFVVPGWTGDLYGNGHIAPKGTIWLNFLMAFLPWSFAFLPLMLRAGAVVKAFMGDRSGLLTYLLVWALSPLILFTPAANILAAYVLPGLPAAAILLILLWNAVWSERPTRSAVWAFATAVGTSFASFAAIAVTAFFWPNLPQIKSQAPLVAAAHEFAPDLPLYVVGGRSFSAEFYTQGAARSVSLEALDQLEGAALLSVPRAWRDEVDAKNYQILGTYGRHFLFEKPVNGGNE